MRINALPADAAMRRNGTWSHADEIAALTLERAEIWAHVHAQLLCGEKTEHPGLLEISHPDRPDGSASAPRKRPTSDPNEIRQFLGRVGR